MPAYKRILLKLSGEALMGDDAYGINRATIVRMVREIRPDFVVTTHSAEELHGHDLAIAELLPIAAAQAGAGWSAVLGRWR